MADEGMEDTLRNYRSRRDFSRTPEPGNAREREGGDPIFVIQKHRASTLHYDFRLETDGVLKSWAVPKGPSTNPEDKRLALPTEDHPLAYADFEGTIPEGEYGAGTVMIWDRGTYRNLTEKDGRPVSVTDAIAAGHLTVLLNGVRLVGGFSLTRFRTGKGESWLLIKKQDEAANMEPGEDPDRSVVSGRSFEEITGK
jgi:DNA ligase D-like protein (predicted 3'-phosphoesterase)